MFRLISLLVRMFLWAALFTWLYVLVQGEIQAAEALQQSKRWVAEEFTTEPNESNEPQPENVTLAEALDELDGMVAEKAESGECYLPADFFERYEDLHGKLEGILAYRESHAGTGLHDREADKIAQDKATNMLFIVAGEMATLLSAGKGHIVAQAVSMFGSGIFAWGLASSTVEEDKFGYLKEEYEQRHFSRQRVVEIKHHLAMLDSLWLAADMDPTAICPVSQDVDTDSSDS